MELNKSIDKKSKEKIRKALQFRDELIRFLILTNEIIIPEGKNCIDIVDNYLKNIKYENNHKKT